MNVSHGRRDDLNDFSILTCLSVAEKKAIVEQAKTNNKLNRCIGSMVGMAVGDALGHPFEFMPTTDVPGEAYFDLETLRFHGESNAFRLERGQWTDDAAMGLCMADSIIMQGNFSGANMRVRFWCWWNRGYNNAFRKDRSRESSVGLGGNIAKSLMALTPFAGPRRAEIPDTYNAPTEDAGNGSLMRFTPISIWLHSASYEEVYKYSRFSSYSTHPGIIAAEACSLLGHLIVAALNLPPGPVDPKAFLEEQTAEYMRASGLASKSGWGYDEMKWLVLGKPERQTERCWAWREESLDIAGTLRARGRSYNGYPVSAGYFGSYSMDGLAMAMWSIYHTKSFDEAVTRSVNLLGDADSHGSITGQLGGALYGYNSINPQFIEWLTRWDDHEFA
jgi:ADP-ribosyl-[dinitrogen reductase] hydrolase